ncbi:uncharacterized protein LOC141588160 [Silene latifolia]|uniref:uncharacterized protein LOC141588160 n=1 Tax=Silene latifolia TaxID=37657 RepID=UPI003D77F367
MHWAKKLSYAGRLTLVNSVLNTLHNYWGSIFLIPKAVVRKIEAICRNCFWEGGSEYQRVPLVAWDKDRHFNVPPSDSNWNWRNICKVKGLMSTGYVNNHWDHDPKFYSLKSGYGMFQGGRPSIGWHKDVWDICCVPKHSIISWLVHDDALNTREKLFRLKICDRNQCVLCENGVETHQHLFHGCNYGEQIKIQLDQWLQFKFNTHCMELSELQVKVCKMVIVGFWYRLWLERNSCRIDQQLTYPERIVQELKRMIHARIKLEVDGMVLNANGESDADLIRRLEAGMASMAEEIEKLFLATGYPKDQKVDIATYYLKDEDDNLWALARAGLEVQPGYG